MKHKLKSLYGLYAIVIAVVFIIGCGGKGFSKPSFPVNNSVQLLIPHGELTWKDSLIQEMVDFLNPTTKLSRSDKKKIEFRIKSFPQKIVRRDTTSYFIQTAYAIAYYEFYKKDYKRALAFSRSFEEKGVPPGLLNSFLKYSSVAFSARTSLTEKAKIKYKPDKNSWFVPLKFDWLDSLKFSYKRTYTQFLDSYIDDIPMDCDISTYAKILTAYHDGDGQLSWLNGYSNKGFFQKCKDAHREDILSVVYALWNVKNDDFEYDKNFRQIKFRTELIAIDTTSVKGMYNTILSYDIGRNVSQIDSLITIGENPSKHILQLLSLCYDQNRFSWLCNYCQQYENFIDEISLGTLYNYWGLGSSFIGRYESAIEHYDKAIKLAKSEDARSTMRLNKGCTLGEMGRTDEAVQIFMEEWRKQQTPFDKFVWNDNLGHVYSFADPRQALYYFDRADKYLDKSTLYDERKVRHFCRKARVYQSNSFLRRVSIDRAFAILQSPSNIIPSKVGKGMAYTELGAFLNSTFDFEEANRYFEKAYACYEWLMPEDARYVYLTREYARNLCDMGRNNEAINILEEQLALQDSILGVESNDSYKTLQMLITANCNSGTVPVKLYERYLLMSSPKFDMAADFNDAITRSNYLTVANDANGAIDVITGCLSKDINPLQRIELAKRLETLARQYKSTEEYISIIRPLVEPLKRDVISSILLLSGEERISIQTPIKSLIDGMIEKNDYSDALSLSLFRKGLLLTTKSVVEGKLADNRKTKKRYNELQTLRIRLNDCITFEDSVKIPELTLKVNQLERELNHTLANNDEIYRSIDKNVGKAIENLAPGQVAIDFLRYQSGDSISYGAFVIHNSGTSRFIFLCTENEISKTPFLVWEKLKAEISNAAEVYFCPDGILNNSGIEFLKDSDGIPMLQKYNLHRVFHLADIQPHEDIGDKVVAVGVSDHNSPIGNAETIDRGTMTDLPNVAYEMRLIGQRLDPNRLTLLFNDNATEIEFKRLGGTDLSSLHISTHGIYRDYGSLNASAGNPDDDDYHIAQRMLRAEKESLSGLILRQGNLSWKSDQVLDENDDILTSEEIENMTFPNLQLTVLSACDSGLGDIDSEGVWGLQRAFRIAGSKSLICSLQKIDDYWTAQFMDAFYEYAGQGKSIYESFHHAQKELFEAEPNNPDIWSSFILIE